MQYSFPHQFYCVPLGHAHHGGSLALAAGWEASLASRRVGLPGIHCPLLISCSSILANLSRVHFPMNLQGPQRPRSNHYLLLSEKLIGCRRDDKCPAPLGWCSFVHSGWPRSPTEYGMTGFNATQRDFSSPLVATL